MPMVPVSPSALSLPLNGFRFFPMLLYKKSTGRWWWEAEPKKARNTGKQAMQTTRDMAILLSQHAMRRSARRTIASDALE